MPRFVTTPQDRSPPHRSAARLLRVLRALNEHPFCRLAELHEVTQLPKPTLLRLLGTLEDEGYVRFDRNTSIYVLSAKVLELSAGYTRANLLISVAAPILLRETKRIKWPLALGLLEGDEMVVRFSTMPYSPLAVENNSFGHRHALLRSALGLAYLFGCLPSERRRLLGRGPVDDPPQRLVDALSSGYGLRLPSKQGESATLSVPISLGRRSAAALGALSLTTFGRTMTPVFIAQYHPVLREIASSIVSAYLKAGDEDPLS